MVESSAVLICVKKNIVVDQCSWQDQVILADWLLLPCFFLTVCVIRGEGRGGGICTQAKTASFHFISSVPDPTSMEGRCLLASVGPSPLLPRSIESTSEWGFSLASDYDSSVVVTLGVVPDLLSLLIVEAVQTWNLLVRLHVWKFQRAIDILNFLPKSYPVFQSKEDFW